jgi:hypothetical protein
MRTNPFKLLSTTGSHGPDDQKLRIFLVFPIDKLWIWCQEGPLRRNSNHSIRAVASGKASESIERQPVEDEGIDDRLENQWRRALFANIDPKYD